VVEFLEKKYPWILSPELTAEMEKKLDLVEHGKLDWKEPVQLKHLIANVKICPNNFSTLGKRQKQQP